MTATRFLRAGKGLLLGSLLFGCLPATGAALTADEIMAKAIENYRNHENLPARYSYMRHNQNSELDASGKLKRHRERLYQIIPIGGKPHSRLLERDGRPLSQEELDIEDEKERAFRENGPEEEGKSSRWREVELNEELVKKLSLRLAGRETVNGRGAYVLHFTGRKDMAVRSLEDRVIHRVAGKIWIDEEEFEVARLRVELTERVTLAWGLVGALHQFQFNLHRLRLEPGYWFDGDFDGFADIRQFVTSKRLRWRESLSDFARTRSETVQSETGAGKGQ